jgi:uncharacterized membrane protein (DUF4010 family)
MKHATPLKLHMRDPHLWWDLALLMSAFAVAVYYPWFKIVPLVACLELLSFLSFHLVAQKHSLNLQGFLGGFISSTAVFLQLLNDPKFSTTPQTQKLSALLLAMIAMLLECILILFFLADVSLLYYWPFILQCMIFLGALAWLNKKSHSIEAGTTTDLTMAMDHPILWKNVAKLSLLIFIIITFMQWIDQSFSSSREISTLLISLFEAHAVLAATLSESSLHHSNINLMHLILIILLGNVCSKSYFIMRSHFISHKTAIVAFMLLSYVFTLVVSLALINELPFLKGILFINN